ncbi:CvfB family protein [Halalkalibacterium ligniniphilum]|uniref:CvfB family protein n=1 Tax=Halalkalibacterium ligniniphilum TaxID=1134413 RepID=UPI00034A5D25|nr:S1-like domain-containing RNA-binding protein [Halalkalibacterium ligniniphilum]
MELKPGMTVLLEVVREANFGVFLSDGTTDILLHKREMTNPVQIGETLEVFLYHDHDGRLAATTSKPLLDKDGMAWLEVVSVKQGHGLFLFNGTSRDLFLSMDELPEDRELWPQQGDRIPVSMTWDKKGRMMGKLVKGHPIEKISKKGDSSLLKQEVTATIYHFLSDGAVLLSEEGYLCFLHNTEMNHKYRLGEKVNGRVLFVREDGRLNITTFPPRKERQYDDAEVVYEYLLSRGGSMPYWDKTTPEDIQRRFQMSKAAFKRALGKLMKEGKVYQKDGWTYQKEKQ